MKKGMITFFLWPVGMIAFVGIFSQFAKSTPPPGLESPRGETGLMDPVYGETSHLFQEARDRYPVEYSRYREYYEGQGEWNDFAAPGIPAIRDDQVLRAVEYFQTSRRADFEAWLKRAGKYLPLMRRILVEQGLPGELVCLAMVESGFDEAAVSHAEARGCWQFIPQTARRYGLRVDDWVDERMDAERSTVAAARLLGDLYDRYGSWEFAIAAYNAGDLRVQDATGEIGCREFWIMTRLGIFNQETRNHVVKFYSALTIMRDLDGFGFNALDLDAPLVYDQVDCPPRTRLSEVARLLGVREIVLSDLNPHLIRRETPPEQRWFPIHVPLGSGNRFREYFPAGSIS